MFGLGQREPPQPIGETQKVEQQNQIPFYQKSEELGKEMLNVERVLEKIRLQLLGYVETSEGEYEQLGEKLVNQRGAAAIITMISSHIGKEVFLTKITDYDKVRITRDIWATLVMLIIKNRKEWALGDDIGKWKLIRGIVMNQIYFALCRGVEGVEKRFFADVYQEKQLVSQNSQQQFKKGFFGG